MGSVRPPHAPPAARVPAPGSRADTTLAARPGERLVVENFSGRVLVEGHGSERVELRPGPDRDTDLGLARRGDRIVVTPAERRPADRDVRIGIRVPRWMPVSVQGRDLDVEVVDVEGRVEVRNVEGDVVLREIRGGARASSVDGSIRVHDARGDLLLRSRGDDVTVDGASGEVVDAESGDGDVWLQDVDALRVRAETLDGDVLFDVTPRSGGRYRVAVHDGDARVRIPRDAGLLVRVATFDGEFLSDVPVTVERLRAGGTFEFQLGDGSGELEIEVFDGEIRLEERTAPRGFD